MSKLKASFKMPKPVKITGRSSTITNSFVSSIIPVIQPSEKEIALSLELLGMSPNKIECTYCGDNTTEWDHLNPLVEDKGPSGYISEIANLVPSCGKCNQSKGNTPWRTWIVSSVPLSPKTKGVPELGRRIKLLEEYEERNHPKHYDFEQIIGTAKWKKYWDNRKKLLSVMKDAQEVADQIREEIRRETK